jgi:hypothetical protein
MTYEQSMMNAGQRYFAEPVVFAVRKSLGLIWVTEFGEPDDCREREETDHGPFMDAADAFEQCGKPSVWVVEFSA